MVDIGPWKGVPDEAVYLLCRDRKGEHCVKPKAGLLKNPLW